MFEKKNETEANINLQFHTVIVQNSFHPIYKISLQIIELLLTLLQFSNTKLW